MVIAGMAVSGNRQGDANVNGRWLIRTVLVVMCAALAAGFAENEPAEVLKPTETLESVEAQCARRCREHASLTARLRLNKEINSPQGEVTIEAIGEYQHQRKGEKLMFRVELKNTVVTRSGGRESKVEQKVLTISDGQFSYNMAEMGGQVINATKSLSQPAQTMLADENFFKTLRTHYELRLMPEEQIDGQEVWVIEARPRRPAPGGPAKTMHYLLKEGGIRLRSTDHDASGRRIQLTGLSEIKFDEKIDPRRFIFTVPKDIKIMDLTGS